VTCTACGAATSVVDSRKASSAAKGLTGDMRTTGEQLVHWYTSDWVVRRRMCVACGHAETTIELFATDFRAIIKEGLPHE